MAGLDAQQVIDLIVQLEPLEAAAIGAIVQGVKALRDGSITAEQARATATEALGLLLGRAADLPAQDAATDAKVDAEVAQDSKEEPK